MRHAARSLLGQLGQRGLVGLLVLGFSLMVPSGTPDTLAGGARAATQAETHSPLEASPTAAASEVPTPGSGDASPGMGTRLYVTNFSTNMVTVFPLDSSGNIAGAPTIVSTGEEGLPDGRPSLRGQWGYQCRDGVLAR